MQRRSARPPQGQRPAHAEDHIGRVPALADAEQLRPGPADLHAQCLVFQARQNQLLLSRAVEAHEEALRVLMPDTFKARTYSARGAVSAGSVVSGWQAAG